MYGSLATGTCFIFSCTIFGPEKLPHF